MSRTLAEILTDVNAYMDLEAAQPTGDELVARANYANQAVWDASAFVQLSEFSKVYEVDPAANASISMPSDFREFMGAPQQLQENGTWEAFPQIEPRERYEKASSDKYCYLLGDPAGGYTAVFNGLTANATLSVDYQRFPSGLLTLTDKCELPDPMYVVTKVKSFILQSRSDERFPQVDGEAARRLQNMVGRESKGTMDGGTRSLRKSGIAAYSIG